MVAGQTAQLTWVLRNQGAADVNSTWTDRVYLSNDNVIGNDTFVRDLPVTVSIPAGQTITRTQSVPIPSGLSGNYRFVVSTDILDRVQEFNNEGNNSLIDDAVVTIDSRPSANLVIDSVTGLTSNLFSGQPATVEWVVRNAGNASTDSAGWEDQLFLSTDALPSADDVYLGRAFNPSYLNVNDSYRNTLTVRLPKMRLAAATLLSRRMRPTACQKRLANRTTCAPARSPISR